LPTIWATVRNAIRAFNKQGLECLEEGSHRANHLPSHTAFFAEKGERLKELVCQGPRGFGKGKGLRTLKLLTEVGFEQGLTERPGDGVETVRASLERLGVRWRRARRWIASPEPWYASERESAAG